MRIFKYIMFILFGMCLAVGLFCVVVGIAAAINHIGFPQQIAEWFGKESTSVALEFVKYKI